MYWHIHSRAVYVYVGWEGGIKLVKCMQKRSVSFQFLPPSNSHWIQQLPRSKSQCTPTLYHWGETMASRLKLERLTTSYFQLGFPGIFNRIAVYFWINEQSHIPPLAGWWWSCRKPEPVSSQKWALTSNGLLAKVKDTSKTKLYNSTH